MNIPSRVNPFGYDNTIPPGYTRAEFLEVARRDSQCIPTAMVDVWGYKISFEVWGQDLLTIGGVRAYDTEGNNFNRNFHVYSQYETPLMQFFISRQVNCYQEWGWADKKRTFVYNDADYSVFRDGVQMKANAYDQGYVYQRCDKGFCIVGSKDWIANRIYSTLGARQGVWKFWNPEGELKGHYLPALDAIGIPCMYDTITGTPFYNTGTGQFTAGLTTKQAINLAHLPVPTTVNTMTVSLPLEAAFDANVQDALNTAADKGWTITVQYRESELTTKNIPADFLESTGTQYIDTGVKATGSMTVELSLALIEVVYPNYAFGANSQSDTKSRLEFTPNYGGGNSVFRYGETNAQTYQIYNALGVKYNWEIVRENVYQNGTKMDYYPKALPQTFTSSVSILCFASRSGRDSSVEAQGSKRLYNFSIFEEGVHVLNFLPTLDSTGTPCMYDTVSGQNFYNANTAEGATPFIVGFDTTEKAAISISKLPVTTDGTLTVSLPAAAQDASSLVPEAINIATNRGWTIITQYRED